MTEQMAGDVGPSRIEMAYECLGDPASPPVLLIMGGGAQMIWWPDEFCALLTGRGLRVIRFDSRDTGRSTRFSDGPQPDIRAAMTGDVSSAAYTLSDMAADTVGLMDLLEIHSAHIVGASLDGMVAQTIALEHPQRVRSLVSMMSSTGDLSVGQPDSSRLAGVGAAPDDRQGYIEWQVRALRAVSSTAFAFDEARIADLAGRSWDRGGHDPLAMLRQAVASVASGDRARNRRRTFRSHSCQVTRICP